MTDALGTVAYQYDTKDRLIQEQRTLTGITGTFTTSYVYNYKGDMTQMTYPSGRVVNFNYATGGGCCNSRLASVVDQTTGTTVASSISYNPAGEITSRTLGSGVIEIRHRPSRGVLKTGRWTHSTHRSKHLIPVSVPNHLRMAWLLHLSYFELRDCF